MAPSQGNAQLFGVRRLRRRFGSQRDANPKRRRAALAAALHIRLMKILFYNHTGQVSGAERLLLMILARMDRAEFDPIVVCPAQDSLSRMVLDLGVPVETIGGLEARFTWRVDQLARYCKSFFQ